MTDESGVGKCKKILSPAMWRLKIAPVRYFALPNPVSVSERLWLLLVDGKLQQRPERFSFSIPRLAPSLLKLFMGVFLWLLLPFGSGPKSCTELYVGNHIHQIISFK